MNKTGEANRFGFQSGGAGLRDPGVSRPARSWLKWAFGAGIGIFVLIAAAGLADRALSALARDRVQKAFQQYFGADLQLRRLDVKLFPTVYVEGEGLVMRQRGRTDAPPLIAIRKFSADTSIWAALLHPPRIHHLYLNGLQIQISRRGDDRPPEQKPRAKVQDFLIESVVADGTTLTVIPRDEGKDPLQYDLWRLRLSNAGPFQPMSFRATLRNAKPPGNIATSGKFGPWNRDDPARTAVAGNYTFRDADLSVFRGISGRLSSDGQYRGVLERIEVDGQTDVPDFALQIGRNPVRLTTQFHAIVDGTDGDTLLQPVKAQFGSSSVVASRGVEGKKGIKGKTVPIPKV
jgi:hypothetical protein